MTAKRKARGGVGSNQYQTVGASRATATSARVAAFSGTMERMQPSDVRLARLRDGSYRVLDGRYTVTKDMRPPKRGDGAPVQDGWIVENTELGGKGKCWDLDEVRKHIARLEDDEAKVIEAINAHDTAGVIRLGESQRRGFQNWYGRSADLVFGDNALNGYGTDRLSLGLVVDDGSDPRDRIMTTLDRLGIADRVRWPD